MLNAEHFKEVMRVSICYYKQPIFAANPVNLQLILLIGNYMNGTGVKGGAFGFKVSSINRVRVT